MSIGAKLKPQGQRSKRAWLVGQAALALASCTLLPACSSQQFYGAGQAWQRQECSKIADAQERSRCMASASASYEDYKRQSEATNAAK